MLDTLYLGLVHEHSPGDMLPWACLREESVEWVISSLVVFQILVIPLGIQFFLAQKLFHPNFGLQNKSFYLIFFN